MNMKTDMLLLLKQKATHARECTGKAKTAARYEDAFRSFRTFLATLGMNDISVENITFTLIGKYEAWLHRERRVCRNTSAAYMRCLRSVYLMAVLEEGGTDKHPFSRVFTSNDKTRKRTLSEDHLKALLSLDVRNDKYLLFCRDLFFFSYLAHGMAFVDMAGLKMSDIQDGRLLYARSKTGKPLSVQIQGALAEIVERHHVDGQEYIFPIIRGTRSPKAYDSALRRYNRGLKRMAAMAGVNVTLSSYCSRHSFASIAYKMNVPVAVISQAMGHSSEKTTRIYLADLDHETVDEQCRRAAMQVEHMMSTSAP